MPASATKILIIDDDADLVSLLTDNLQLEGFSPSPAYNGEDGLLKLSQENFDLVILDVMMPGMKGTEVLAKIREHSHIPVIMLTARGGLENQMEGLDSGADAYFEKPVDFGLLKLTVQNIFRQQQNLKEHYARNYFVDSRELAANQQDNKFISRLIEIIESRIDQPDMDVSYIASELSMSRSKLYAKVKSLTDKSITRRQCS